MRGRRLLAVILGAGALWAVAPGVAQAHPLGNFTVNHYDHVQLQPGRVQVTTVLDRAEIPTAQKLQIVAPDGSPTAAQLASAAAEECADVAGAVQVTVDGAAVGWTVQDTGMETIPGAGGLPTLRLTCRFEADAELDVPAEIAVSDTYLPDRVGWREMTADGDGVRLIDSPVPVTSVSDELRQYPTDLLASPVDVRSFTVATEPGQNTGTGSAITPGSGDPFTNFIAGLDRRLEDLIGDRGLTPLVGTLAVLLAVLLGCGHALLPGHGKTVMAAYLAARRGRSRDAIIVGATVTATHTVGVLVLGLAISLSSTLAGDQVIRWLGVGSGLLVAGIGAFMLRAALPRRRGVPTLISEVLPEPVLAGAVHAAGSGGAVHAPTVPEHAGHDHHHDHAHGHDHGHHHDHAHGQGWWAGGHTHGPARGRAGLIGMGVAGGLVPSPSALIVLLASIGLGRTVFGVLLVLAYGLGMAGTLTAVGLLLVRLRGRMERRLADLRGRRWLTRVAIAAPVLTASLVLLVGVALVARGAVLGA
ncbi:sulfite exporter TauE/SafE family protein [Blastococcus sp. CT_GayMR16]|uniref:nickel/cobalt transporter n=1 Tax=Blastococcus sp. CT_GayMR16 TaxID=2559607 RepID=UPI0010730C9C|nr:sulfite exporter TauE/SafE family protein [Blastococcus sp. CT_GayMR16]TFV87161.1 High-affinity nickel-transporter [Blastococcus sp. CT_GayMR16]